MAVLGVGASLFIGQVLAGPKNVHADTLTTGSLELSVSPATAAISMSGMAPGDVMTAPITVSNDGTLPLRYSVTSTATNADRKALMGRLDLTIKTGVVTCSDAGFGDGGAVLYGPAELGTVIGVDVIGNPAPGFQTGDRILDATDTEVLCLQVVLPPAAGNAFQGASTTASFTFDAELEAGSES